jgi:NAD(P)-dependent dehydrogenase (short-subunit alcohol dehydrogenase family)
MTEFSFEGAVAVVTGGAGGIGRALAARLATEGVRVAIVDLDPRAAELVAAGLPGAIAVSADVGDRAAVRRMVDEVESALGPIDIYCSNAGIASGGGLGEDEAWDLSWRVHAMAHVHAARAVVPGMTDRGRGVFVVTASAAGLLMMMQSAPYTVTKHAAVAIAEWLAVNYGGEGIQFHCLCPQGVRTAMVSSDPRGEAEVAASGTILEPAQVADDVIDAIRSGRFLVLPHPEVHDFETAKVADRDRWLRGMRRLLARVAGT